MSLHALYTPLPTDAGACFVCDGCPNVEEERRSEEGPECASRPRSEGSAACVETTAYTLLALLEAEDTQFTVCLAQWLVRIRSGSGGFYSSQVEIYSCLCVIKPATLLQCSC